MRAFLLLAFLGCASAMSVAAPIPDIANDPLNGDFGSVDLDPEFPVVPNGDVSGPSHVPVCGPVCSIYCEFGHVVDANDCPTCDCRDSPIADNDHPHNENVQVDPISGEEAQPDHTGIDDSGNGMQRMQKKMPEWAKKPRFHDKDTSHKWGMKKDGSMSSKKERMEMFKRHRESSSNFTNSMLAYINASYHVMLKLPPKCNEPNSTSCKSRAMFVHHFLFTFYKMVKPFFDKGLGHGDPGHHHGGHHEHHGGHHGGSQGGFQGGQWSSWGENNDEGSDEDGGRMEEKFAGGKRGSWGQDTKSGGWGEGGHGMMGGWDQGGHDMSGSWGKGGQGMSGGWNRGGHGMTGGWDQGGHDKKGGWGQGGHDMSGSWGKGGHGLSGGWNGGGHDMTGGWDQGGHDKKGGWGQGGHDISGNWGKGGHGGNDGWDKGEHEMTGGWGHAGHEMSGNWGKGEHGMSGGWDKGGHGMMGGWGQGGHEMMGGDEKRDDGDGQRNNREEKGGSGKLWKKIAKADSIDDVIEGFADMLGEKGSDNGKQSNALERITKGAKEVVGGIVDLFIGKGGSNASVDISQYVGKLVG